MKLHVNDLNLFSNASGETRFKNASKKRMNKQDRCKLNVRQARKRKFAFAA